MERPFFSIPGYHDFLSPPLARHLLRQAQPVDGVPGLREIGEPSGLETREALRFLAELYRSVAPSLARVLRRRTLDRKFIDERMRACHELNRDLQRKPQDPDYLTPLGLEDAEGRIVFGPRTPDYFRPGGKPVAPLPEFLKGPHVTLFGPPDDAKMAINAMNAFHRSPAGEPEIVGRLASSQPWNPMWGADDEDSKTPIHADLRDAAVNLTGCMEGSITHQERGRSYALAQDRLALPIKRFPGLALPAPFLFLDEDPIPLHLYDFALHLFRNRKNPRALVFYVPKLENEEEARYLHEVISTAEKRIRELEPAYRPGSVRLMIVLENPRAIVRAHEIMDALHPYFAGASLGWHDYLASTARLFKEDSHYRIPVKADPDIVIKHIQASHRLLAEVVGSRGGIQVGGMYGILPLPEHPESYQIALRGFIKDVVIQLKRKLTGFWVAHPDFVRLGLALVEAWRLRSEKGDPAPLRELVSAVLLNEKYRKETLAFIEAGNTEHPLSLSSLLVTDIRESDFIANNDPEEVRYNVFQCLQYLADWLCGNGCVALPTLIDGIPVRVMDDLATTERSRWEVWHELRHGRFEMGAFVRIVHEEMNFIRRDLSDGKKIVKVKWDERTARWYPIARRILLQLMTDPSPAEFASELLLPFTIDSVRSAPDPWVTIQAIDPGKFRLPREVAAFDHYFEICGSPHFAREMAKNPVEDLELARTLILALPESEVRLAASFHGDIGQSKATLDAQAASEQSRALAGGEKTLQELRRLGQDYLKRFGVKFLISAKGRTADELLSELKRRLGHSSEQELANARQALWEISQKRMTEAASSSRSGTKAAIEALRARYGIAGVSLAISEGGHTQSLSFGDAQAETRFQIASLSKSIATAFALEYFKSRGIALTTPVNSLLPMSATSAGSHPAWSDELTLAHLVSHSALNMHYVQGIPASRATMPRAGELLRGQAELGYEPVRELARPGTEFHYSGGGFLVLEHLIETLENGKPIQELTRPFLEKLGLSPELTFDQRGTATTGHLDSGQAVPGGGLLFPAFAAGVLGTSRSVARFLEHLTRAYRRLEGSSAISHDTAVQMLRGLDGGVDRGSRAFMGCDVGLGIFTIEAGANRWALHQGANEGFRALFMHCFDGPDAGKGFVILCNGDNRAVLLISEVARELLTALDVSGVDLARLGAAGFDFSSIPQEQIVNLGYKALIFGAFEPDLPEKIIDKGPLDPLSSRNLAVEARIVAVTNQKFARAENLISPHEPVFDPGLFGRQGKIMDSWETVRHNPLGRDLLELELTQPSGIRFVSFSTRFHDGNQPEFVQLEALSTRDGQWRELVAKTPLAGHSLLRIDLGGSQNAFSRVRLGIFPDGGITRLGLYEALPDENAKSFLPAPQARCVRFADAIPRSQKPLTLPYEPDAREIERNLRLAPAGFPMDWASRAFGGRLVRASNEHYGPAIQVISPFPPLHMFDGLESARSRKPGHHEEVVIGLGRAAELERVVLDFEFFVNNNPVDVSIEARSGDAPWRELVSRTRVKTFANNQKEFRISPGFGPVDELLIRAYPDGGINRVRAMGRIS